MIDFLEILALAIICAVAFYIRLIPIIRARWFGNDSYYHLTVSRWWRRYHKYPRSDPDLLPTNANTYPPLLQVLTFPFASISDRAAMLVLSPVIDVMTIVLLFLWFGRGDFPQPLLPPLIYAISANNILDASTLNPRPLGNLLLAGTMIAAFVFLASGDLVTYLALVFLEALVLLSHKLSVQVMVPLVAVCSIGMMTSYKYGDWAWPALGSLPLAVLLATLMTGGAYITRILPDHIRYIGVHLRKGDYRTGRRAVPSPINLFKSNPIAYAAPLLGIISFLYGARILGFQIWLPWSVTVFALAQLWIWGDSWRYLQLGTIPGAFIIVLLIVEHGLDEALETALLALLVLGLACIAVLQLRIAIMRDKARRIADAIGSMPDDWRKLVKGKRIYSNVQHYIVPYLLDSSVLLGSPSSDGMKASFRIAELSKGSLKDISRYAKDEIKEPLDYALVLNDFPKPSLEGYTPHLQSKDVTIFKMSTGG